MGGLTEQARANSPDGVDFPPGRMPRDLEVVGSANGGPLCHQSDKEVAPLLRSSPGPNVDRDGRHVARLV